MERRVTAAAKRARGQKFCFSWTKHKDKIGKAMIYEQILEEMWS